MSQDYLTKIFNDFSEPDGTCKILHGTEGASTGIDVGDIDAVIDYGCPQICARRYNERVDVDVEPTIGLYCSCPSHGPIRPPSTLLGAEGTDPDRPISGRLLKDSKKPDRAGLAMILYVRSTLCLRDMIRRYLADESEHALAISTHGAATAPIWVIHFASTIRLFSSPVDSFIWRTMVLCGLEMKMTLVVCCWIHQRERSESGGAVPQPSHSTTCPAA
ncbi:hypothetical protein FB45DRAFT_1067541 [Roridomyces roridus]|uniref:Helicase C-terminal domain-containing protein n=1 Tax=Roridomyces roridus TaxID=1738132 RepID=A0AAD7FB74_9AGAR|nr:hypothetical protein FB45DRAFT_1067541 [Roridomyces roridus]